MKGYNSYNVDVTPSNYTEDNYDLFFDQSRQRK